ncbi:hypothetical protein F4212_10005 [Candidatus Poribacteria bacterium]|nr:hypothetical protein [Candidatus Poribacteria bacterium]
MKVTKDIIENPGDPVPPIFGGYRPDIIGKSSDPRIQLVIAEAKTVGDVERTHTLCQIDAFIGHLESMQSANRTFILAVNGPGCEKARNVLNFNCRHRVTENIEIELFDGLDFWRLGAPGDTLWRLS